MVFLSREVLLCFQTPTYLSLVVNDTLKLPQHGWTQIESSINDGESTTFCIVCVDAVVVVAQCNLEFEALRKMFPQ